MNGIEHAEDGRREADKDRLIEELRNAVRARDEFVAIAAHEGSLAGNGAAMAREGCLNQCAAEHERLHLTYRVRIGSGEWQEVTETIRIVRVRCRVGGARPYFISRGT